MHSFGKLGKCTCVTNVIVFATIIFLSEACASKRERKREIHSVKYSTITNLSIVLFAI